MYITTHAKKQENDRRDLKNSYNKYAQGYKGKHEHNEEKNETYAKEPNGFLESKITLSEMKASLNEINIRSVNLKTAKTAQNGNTKGKKYTKNKQSLSDLTVSAYVC